MAPSLAEALGHTERRTGAEGLSVHEFDKRELPLCPVANGKPPLFVVM